MSGEQRPILVVDDDSDLREAVADVLRDEGFDVITAAGGRQALDLLAGGLRPGVILLDMMMSEMDGRQFRAAQTANVEWASIPTIVVSAYTDTLRTAAELGAAGGLQKPFRMAKLVREVARFVSRA